MASSGDVSIRFGAQIGDLMSALDKVSDEVARSDQFFKRHKESVNAFDGALEKLIGTLDPTSAAARRLEQSVEMLDNGLRLGLVSAQQHADLMGRAQAAYGSASNVAKGYGQAMEGVERSTMGARREVMVLGHEMLSGNFSRIPGTLMVLAERTDGTSGAFKAMANFIMSPMGAIAAIAGIGFAAVEAARYLDHLAGEVQHVKDASARSGFQASEDQIKGFIEQIKHLDGVSEEEAASIVSSFARIRGMSVSEMQAMVTAIDPIARALGDKVPEAAKRIAAAFADPTKAGHAFMESMTDDVVVLNRFDDAIKGGHQAEGVRLMAHEMENLALKVAEGNPHLLENLSLMEKWQLRQKTLDQGIEPTERNKAKVKFQDDMGSAEPGPQTKQFTPMAALSEQAETLKNNISKTNAEIAADTLAFWEAQKTAYQSAGQQTLEIDRQIASARVALTRQTSTDIVSQTHAALAEKTAALGGNRQAIIQAEISADRALLANDQVSAEEKLTIQRGLGAKMRQLSAEAHSERMAALERDLQAAAKGSQERIAIAERELAEVKAFAGAGSAAAIDAERKVNAERKAAADEDKRIEREKLDAKIQLARESASVTREELALSFDLGQISRTEEFAALRKLRADEHALDMEALTAKANLEHQTAAEHQKAVDAMALADKKYALDVAKLSKQEADSRLASIKQWSEPFTSAVHSMVQGFMQGTLTMSQLARNAAVAIASSYVSKFGDIAVEWLNKHVIMAAYDEMFGAAQVATETTTNAATTAEVEAASAAKTAAMTAEATASIAAAKAVAAGAIPAYAAIAGAAAMSSVACIPFVGWAMAPEVGGETYADAMLYLPMASAAGGWGEVPYDGAIAELHKSEMVLPASIATPLRNMVTAPASNANAPAGRAPTPIVNNIAISSPDAANVANLFKRNGSSLVTALNRQISLGAAIAGRN